MIGFDTTISIEELDGNEFEFFVEYTIGKAEHDVGIMEPYADITEIGCYNNVVNNLLKNNIINVPISIIQEQANNHMMQAMW